MAIVRKPSALTDDDILNALDAIDNGMTLEETRRYSSISSGGTVWYIRRMYQFFMTHPERIQQPSQKQIPQPTADFNKIITHMMVENAAVLASFEIMSKEYWSASHAQTVLLEVLDRGAKELRQKWGEYEKQTTHSTARE